MAGFNESPAMEARRIWYDQTWFRSSLEADWAATMHSLSLEWLYEPEKFRLPENGWYLPDFYLPKIGTWIEVKGENVPRVEKARELARLRCCHCPTTCICAFPGGEIVLIGQSSTTGYKGERYLRYGALRWKDGLGRTASLFKCRACDSYSWVRFDHRACRQCGERVGHGHLIGSGEIEFRKADRPKLPPVA